MTRARTPSNLFDLVRRARRRDDNGAVAVIVAICTILLFGVAAMAVDLGNGWSRRRSAQTDADFAALAGAAKLPATDPASQLTARTAAWNYLKLNLPKDDDGADAGPLTNYSDGSNDNGEIIFPTPTQIKVWVPRRKVAFGIAAAVGFNSVTVSATATAAIRSPKRLLPFFLASSCANYGQHIIKLSSPNPTYNWESPKATGPNAPNPLLFTPPAVNSNSSPNSGPGLITGTNLDAVSKVALIPPDGSSPIEITNFTAPTPIATSVAFTVPTLNVIGVWYVQVLKPSGSGSGWSTDNQNQAPSFVVSDPSNNCNQSSSGDFGTIDSPRDGVNGTADALIDNTALGLDHGLSCFPGSSMPPGSSCPPGTFTLPPPYDPNDSSTNSNCTTSGGSQTPIDGGVLDIAPSNDAANCPGIYTGNRVSGTTAGLISGNNNPTVDGRLTQNASTGCAPPSGGQNPRSVSLSNQTYSINNDTMDCYFLPGVSLTGLTNTTVPLFTQAIYDSPRLFFVPVLHAKAPPANGYYPIVDFRAVFLTDEAPPGLPGAGAATNNNGLTFNNNQTQIESLTVYVFPLAALPDEANNGGTIPYLGVGPRIPVLID